MKALGTILYPISKNNIKKKPEINWQSQAEISLESIMRNGESFQVCKKCF